MLKKTENNNDWGKDGCLICCNGNRDNSGRADFTVLFQLKNGLGGHTTTVQYGVCDTHLSIVWRREREHGCSTESPEKASRLRQIM